MTLALSPAIRRPAEHTSLAPAKQRILETANRLFYNDGIRAGGDRSTDQRIRGHEGDLLQALRVEGRTRPGLPRRTDTTELDRELWRHVDAHEDVIGLLRSLLAYTIDTVMAPGFRGCAFLNAAAEYSDPKNPVRRAVVDHREWYSEVLSNCSVRPGTRCRAMPPTT